MQINRRAALLALLTGSVAGLALVMARKGIPGSRALAKAVAPKPAEAKANLYGYKEVKLS